MITWPVLVLRIIVSETAFSLSAVSSVLISLAQGAGSVQSAAFEDKERDFLKQSWLA